MGEWIHDYGGYALGVGAFIAMWGAALFGRRVEYPDGYCRECGHAAGVKNSRFGPCCADSDEASGLASAPCYCTNDYHWNYEAVT